MIQPSQTADDIITDLANTSFAGIVDVVRDYQLPIMAEIHGCRFCGSHNAHEHHTHKDNCLWVRARLAVGLPVKPILVENDR